MIRALLRAGLGAALLILPLAACSVTARPGQVTAEVSPAGVGAYIAQQGLAPALPPLPLPAPGVHLTQDGQGNAAEVATGPGNSAVLVQHGDAHAATLTQSGTGQSAVLVQSGTAAQANIVQQTDGAGVIVLQHGWRSRR